MIDYIKGEIAELSPAEVIIDCNGIGYSINISLMDYTRLEEMKGAKLYIYEAIREDAHILYGFLEKRARELFLLLTGVSGVGPNTARLILSAMNTADLEQTLASGDDRPLRAVKGIGAKTAQRIIIDLKDKIKVDVTTLSSQPAISSEAFNESLAALTMLGFSSQPAQKALRKIFKESPSTSVENAIKTALKML